MSLKGFVLFFCICDLYFYSCFYLLIIVLFILLNQSMDVLKTGTLHVNGVRGTKKRALVSDTAKHIDVLFLQEVHSD